MDVVHAVNSHDERKNDHVILTMVAKNKSVKTIAFVG